MRKNWFMLCLGLLLSLPLWGHVGSHPRIQQIGMEIEAMESDPDGESPGLLARLYQLRGEEYLVVRDWEKALADFLRSRQLQPSGIRVSLPMARAYYERGEYEQALDEIDRYLHRYKNDDQGLLLRSHILHELGRYRDALRDLQGVLAKQSRSRPDIGLVLYRAELQGRLGEWSAALGGIREAEAALGKLPVLETKRIELLRKQGDFDAALAVLDPLLAQAQRKERWLLLKAQVLEQAGRLPEAKQQYQGVLDALDRLPARLSRVPAMKKLRNLAQQGLMDGNTTKPSADTAVQPTGEQ